MRSDIDKLLSKYAFGGMTDGATQVMNVTQSNLSSSSVNPSHFGEGGGVLPTRTIGDMTYKVFKDGNGYNVLASKAGSSMWKVGKPMSKVEAVKLLGSLVDRKAKGNRFEDGGGVSSYGKGGRMFGEDAKLEYIDDAFASDELKDELKDKLGIKTNSLGDNVVISFAYTDYGGDFLDKVAIRYFEENYPENTIVENAGYNGQNAYVFGEPAQEWIDTTDDYPLGFENIEDLYYEMQNEAEYESYEYFLDDLERDDYVFDKDEVINWLMENKGGYYSMTTQGLDFSSSDLTDELFAEGLIRKEEEYAKGGGVKYNQSWHQDHYRHNKGESYEVPVAKRKHKYANGGVVGQEIVFDDNGEENTGVIKEIHENTGDYIVSTDDGRTILVQLDRDVISLGGMRKKAPIEAPRKRFGFFEKGGGVNSIESGDKVIITTDKLGKKYQGMKGEVTNRKLLNKQYSIKTDDGMTLALYKEEFRHNSINPKYKKGGGVNSMIRNRRGQ